MRIKYYELEEPKRLTLKEFYFNEKEINSNEVFCETIYTSISPGTELSAYKGDAPLIPGKAYPRILGYCNISRVILKGSKVDYLKLNDVIISFQSHRSHFKLQRNDFCFRIGNISDYEARKYCNLYLFHLGYHSLLSSKILPGKNIGIIGCGTLGFATSILCSALGFKTFIFSNQKKIVSNPTIKNIDFNYKNFDAFKKKYDLNNISNQIDIIINTSNTWEDWKFALNIVSYNGEIINLGFPGRGQNNPDFNPLNPIYTYFKNLTIKSLIYLPEKNQSTRENRFNLSNNFSFIKNLIDNNQIDPEDLITDSIMYFELEDLYKKYLDKDKIRFSSILKWKN